jgi:hypothetical protein
MDTKRGHSLTKKREKRTVGHAQDSRPSVLELKVLVSELGTVDALATSTVVVGEIPLQDKRQR